jgi:integrase
LSIIFLLAGIKTFFFENDKELPRLFWKRLVHRVRGSRSITMDKVPSNAELKQILHHMPAHGKALFLVLASSGMRIGECLRLKLNDIELDKDPVRVNLRAESTKSGNNRLTFVSTEAKEAIQAWLKVREKYIDSAIGKSWMYRKQKKDDRLFPFTGSVSHIIWKIATEKVGLLKRDPRTKKYLLHPHSLRKFFRTRMGAVVPVDIVEALMGHEGYLTAVYRKYSQEQLADFYKKGESSLLVISDSMLIYSSLLK